MYDKDFLITDDSPNHDSFMYLDVDGVYKTFDQMSEEKKQQGLDAIKNSLDKEL